MKSLSAGLTFFNVSTVCGLLLGILARGLTPALALLSLLVGLVAGLVAWWQTFDPGETIEPDTPSPTRYGRIFLWLMVALFALFAVRSFCWLFYIDGDEFMIQSPNNLGDLALHLTYIRDFANGIPLWPVNPIYPVGHLRYPAGTDLFNGLLSLAHIDLIRGLVWVGLAASAATCYALFRWGGTFAIAGFLCNGGIVGFQFLTTGRFLDYQGDKTIAWKSLPLSMLVTQRGLLYAIPTGLLLLWQWRQRHFREGGRAPLPFWVEVSLYASLPLFHVHTFLALSLLLAFLFVVGNPPMRGQLLTLVVTALVPATFFVWLITDHFQARAVMEWQPGWVMKDAEFKRTNFLLFWWDNFGILVPLILALFGFTGWRAWENYQKKGGRISEDVAFLVPAAALIVIALLWKLAPWEWDNLKVMIWGYFIILPYLWTSLLRRWTLPLRVALCLALFGSGFISLFGGLAVGRPGFGFANRTELYGVDDAVRSLPLSARFAAYPTFNHPLLLAGRNVLLGYPGHLWTQGFNDYGRYNDRLTSLMMGRDDWPRQAHSLGLRYIFWGREERQNYENDPARGRSTKPWERVLAPIASGTWGAIYDLEQLPPGGIKP